MGVGTSLCFPSPHLRMNTRFLWQLTPIVIVNLIIGSDSSVGGILSTGLRHINKMARHGYADPEPHEEIVYDEPHQSSDGLTYRIFVWRENGKFLGRLYHPPCHGFFNIGVPLDSQEAAIKTAINSIDPNHKAACKK